MKPSDLARMMASGQGGTTEFEGTPAPFSSFPLIDVAEPAVEPVAGELFEAPVEEDGPGALRRAAGAVGRAGMGVLDFGAGAVEPLQIYQDTLFALVVGARDADRSILDYFADLGEKPMAYLPFGERPNRPVDGRMVAESIGITDPDTAKWVGFALDIGAAPGVFGSYLTAIGRIGALARLPGASRVMRLGQNIDDALSLIPVTRGGVTRGLPTLVPQAARDAMSNSVEAAITSIANTPGFSRALQMTTLGVEAAAKVGPRAGAEVMAAVRGVAGEADILRSATLDAIQRLNELLEPQQARGFWGRISEGVGRQGKAIAGAGKGFSAQTQAVMQRALQSVVDQYGIANFDPDALRVMGRAEQPLFGGAVREGPAAAASSGFVDFVREAAAALPERVRERANNFFDLSVYNVRRAAESVGDNADLAEEAFRAAAREASEASALIGYAASLAGPVRDTFLKSVASGVLTSQWARRQRNIDASDIASRVWLSVLGDGMTGGNINDLTSFTLDMGRRRKPLTVTARELFGTDTLGEFLENNKMFNQLDLQVYLRSLSEGHLRRSMGVFMDDNVLRTWISSLESGRLIPSSIISERSIISGLREAGFDDAVEIMTDLVANLKTANRSRAALQAGMSRRRGSGVMLQRNQLLDIMVQRGMTPERAADALNALVGMNNSPAYRKFIERSRDILSDYNQGMQSGQGQGLSGFLRPRKEIPEDVLEVLAEVARPVISLEESGRAAAAMYEANEFARRLYNVAEQFDLVSATPRAGFSQLKTNNVNYGPFQDVYIHPYIERMLTRSIRNAADRTDTMLGRITNAISGGYLAGPDILQGNVASGLATSMYMGLNPFVMITNMAGVLSDMLKVQTGQLDRLADLDLLRHFYPVELSRMGDVSTVRQGVLNLRREVSGGDVNGLRRALDWIGRIARTFIDNPAELVMGRRAIGAPPESAAAATARGAGAAFGLQGFVGMESVMKMAAFRTAQQVGYTVAEAAEASRLAVLDYSELPDLITAFRRYGVLLFPGFSYLIPSRVVRGLLQAPGGTAAVNRTPDAIASLTLTDEEQAILDQFAYDYMRNEIGIPIRVRQGPQGEKILSTFQFARFMPGFSVFNGAFGPATPLVESLLSIGLAQETLVDPFVAITSGTGESTFGGRYGKQVFLSSSTMPERIAQVFGYYANSLAPNTVRDVVSYMPGQGFSGLAPAIIDSLTPMPPELADVGYDRATIEAGRMRRDVADEVIGMAFRTVQPFALGGPYSDAKRSYDRAFMTLRSELLQLQQQAERALLVQDTAKVNELIARADELRQEFAERWGPAVETMQQYNQGNR